MTITIPTTPIIKSLKELARLVYLAAIPVIINYLLVNLSNYSLTTEQIAVVTIVLKCVDKFLHELGGVDNLNNKTLEKGLTRF